MLTIPSSIKSLYQTDGVRKNFRVHFPNGEYSDITNNDVVQESLRFTESLCSQDVFKFGAAESSVIEFETVGVGNMYGMMIEASIEIDTSSLSAADITAIQSDEGDGTLVLAGDSDLGYGFYRIPLGTFKVASCPRNHGAMAHREVTAYTIKQYNFQVFPNLPSTLLYPQLSISSEAFLTNMLDTAQLYDTASFDNTIRGGGNLYTSSKKAVSVRVALKKNNTEVQHDFQKGCSVYNQGTSYSQQWAPSFTEMVTSGYDYEKHYNFGKRVAKRITDSGYNLTYNAAGVKVYDSNETALLDNYPYLFYPCLYYRHKRKADGLFYNTFPYAQKVKPDELIPILTSTKYAFASAFKVAATDIDVNDADILACVNLSGEDEVDYQISLSYPLTSDPTVDLPTFTIDAGVPTALPTINRYELPSYGTMLTVLSSSDGDAVELVNPAGNITHQSYNYSYSYLKMIDSVLEVKAQFLKAMRDGTFQVIRIDNTSPQLFYPSDYSEMWWDEYEVAPIGTVLVTFQLDNSTENAVELMISGGSSVYDMTDNEMLKNMPSATLGSIYGILNTNFAPYADAVAFTPTELTMRGYPWIEAGDAIEVEAEDGTVVDTYALRIEMSGIQHLIMAITASGGEIYEEGN